MSVLAAVIAAVTIPDGYGVAFAVAVLGVGGWVVRELYRTAQIIAKTSATLEALDARLARLEQQLGP